MIVLLLIAIIKLLLKLVRLVIKAVVKESTAHIQLGLHEFLTIVHS